MFWAMRPYELYGASKATSEPIPAIKATMNKANTPYLSMRFSGEWLKRNFVLLASAADPRHNILHHSQWTYYRTVYASEEKCKQNQCYYHTHIKRQQGRQELYLGKPTEPCVECTGEVKEQQRYQCEEHCLPMSLLIFSRCS